MKAKFNGEGKCTVIWLDKESEESGTVHVHREAVSPLLPLISERSSTPQDPTAAPTSFPGVSSELGSGVASRFGFRRVPATVRTKLALNPRIDISPTRGRHSLEM